MEFPLGESQTIEILATEEGGVNLIIKPKTQKFGDSKQASKRVARNSTKPTPNPIEKTESANEKTESENEGSENVVEDHCGCHEATEITMKNTFVLGIGRFTKKIKPAQIRDALAKLRVQESPEGKKAGFEIVDSDNQAMIKKKPQADRRICLNHLREKWPKLAIEMS